MEEVRPPSLEEALARTESDADAVLKAAAAVTKSVKRLRSAAQVGNLRELGPTIGAAEQAIAAPRQQFADAKRGWDFDEEAYFANGAFPRELVRTAERLNVRIFEEDDRLYCYPVLLRVLAGDRAVLIDKTRERRLRPTVLVSHLKELQGRPQRFRSEAFLEALFDAYATLVAKHGRQALGQGRVEKLLDVYELFTLLPGQSREYSLQEYARDLYLLDQSGITTTRKGYAVSFHASTSTRSSGSTIRVITEDGRDKVYYGISFMPAE